MSAVLVLNSGSSSLKFAVFERDAALRPLARGSVSRLGHAPRLSLTLEGVAQAEVPLREGSMATAEAARVVFSQLGQHGLLQHVDLVGHRIVHGGLDCIAPALLDGIRLPNPAPARARKSRREVVKSWWGKRMDDPNR